MAMKRIGGTVATIFLMTSGVDEVRDSVAIEGGLYGVECHG